MNGKVVNFLTTKRLVAISTFRPLHFLVRDFDILRTLKCGRNVKVLLKFECNDAGSFSQSTLQFQLVSDKISRNFFDIICFSLALANISAKVTSLITDVACNV